MTLRRGGPILAVFRKLTQSAHRSRKISGHSKPKKIMKQIMEETLANQDFDQKEVGPKTLNLISKRVY